MWFVKSSKTILERWINQFILFSIYFSGDDDKLSVLPPSTTGSLSSITTTSLVSEAGVGGEGLGNDGGDDKGEKRQLTGVKQELWWQTTIQVAIPFFIAGIGTIGAGIILGHVEVSIVYLMTQSICWELREFIQLSWQNNCSQVFTNWCLKPEF